MLSVVRASGIVSIGLLICAVVVVGELGALTAELYVGKTIPSIVLRGRTGVFTAVV